eukprot:COSAG01_NODE_5324_length_4334_cov_5.824321_1_plen_552_part_00
MIDPGAVLNEQGESHWGTVHGTARAPHHCTAHDAAGVGAAADVRRRSVSAVGVYWRCQRPPAGAGAEHERSVFRTDPLAPHRQSVYFNHLTAAAPCGTAGGGTTQPPPTAVWGEAASLVKLQVKLQWTPPTEGQVPPTGNATITLVGPSTRWFGVAFGATEMAQQPGAIIVSETGAISEYRLGNHVAGQRLATQVVVVSNVAHDGQRTVVLSRGVRGATSAHYTFNASGDGSTLDFMDAVGAAGHSWPSFHKSMSSGTLLLAKLGVANCLVGDAITFGQTPGKFVYHHDDGTTESLSAGVGRCSNSTPTDLIATRNPRCDITTYVGGLSCCHHKWLLTDREQRAKISDEKLVFRMKIRIWFQEYIEATPKSPASHQCLWRMYHSLAGEYDTTKQTASHSRTDVNASNVQVNEFRFKARDMIHIGNVRTGTFNTPQPTANQTGIKLMYINGHCHAAACIQFDLYNDDTGELICRQQGRAGSTLRPDVAKGDDRFDEKGYIRLYPCVFGDHGEGLQPPHFLSFDTNLRSVKITNATYTHYGEMAHWQARGVLA